MGAPLGNCNAAKNKAACHANSEGKVRKGFNKYKRPTYGEIYHYDAAKHKMVMKPYYKKKMLSRRKETISIKKLRAVREGHETVESVKWARKMLGIK